MTKGRHSSQTQGTFYRDLAIMLLGIVAVGAAVFFILYLFADQPETGPTANPTTTTTTTAQATTAGGGGGQTTATTQGNTTTPPTTAGNPGTTVAVRPPSEVTAVVLNSTQIEGAAGRLTEQLAGAGYQTLTPANYTPEQDPSRIWYRDGFAAEGAEMLDYIPGAVVEPLPDASLQEGADVILVIGTGYSE